MTISPLLQSKIQEHRSKNTDHEKIYENLKQHANDVRPNAPKARLVNETLPQSIVSYFKDTKQDFANLKETIKTGKMSDNNLGRLNDLGMKIGGLLIATILAVHSKSKRESVMRFVGTAAFFASMKLWPKIFIFTPAKLIHKVDPGKKYISAQGDKKDFYLDNQFLPWDITDIKDEKEQRRHQKVALQNRTLWMATAGMGVPLMTALISNRLEPVVDKIISSISIANIKRHANAQDGLGHYISSSSEMIRDTKAVEELCDNFKNGELTLETFTEELAKYMDISKGIYFKDPDMAKPLKTSGTQGFTDGLKEFWKEQSSKTFTIDELKELLGRLEIEKLSPSLLSEDGEMISGMESSLKKLSEDQVRTITDSLMGGKEQTIISFKEIERTISQQGIEIGEGVQKCLKGVQWNTESFLDGIKDYHQNYVGTMRGRLARFLKLYNPIVGQNADSVYTDVYSRTMKNLFGKYLSMKKMKKDGEEQVLQNLVEAFQKMVKDVGFDSEEYKKIITGLTGKGLTEAEQGAIETITDPQIIKSIQKVDSEGVYSALDKAVWGKDTSGIFNTILNYTKEQKANINAMIARPAICANFEARLKEGLIKINGADLKDLTTELKVARSIIYEGGRSITDANNLGRAIDMERVKEIIEAIFNEEAFKNEPEVVKRSVQDVLKYIRSGEKIGEQTVRYFTNLNLKNLVNDYVRNNYGSYVWLKRAGIAGLVLAAVTLLVQPLFGNIKNEYKEEDKKEIGGAK